MVSNTNQTEHRLSSTRTRSTANGPAKIQMEVDKASYLFGRCRSRLTGYFMQVYLIPGIREMVIKAYIKAFNINVNEIEKPISEYTSISKFFSRRLMKCARPIASPREKFQLLSPVDGRCMSISRLSTDPAKQWIPMVKGSNYHIPMFVGDEQLRTPKSGYCYYSIVLYLSPADYHHFHSPCDMKITSRKHIVGQVLPVKPSFVETFRNLFSVQERVVLKGYWNGGRMYYVAVAAYNVSDIKVSFDPEVRTNATMSPVANNGKGKSKNWVRQACCKTAYDFDSHGCAYKEREYSLKRLNREVVDESSDGESNSTIDSYSNQIPYLTYDDLGGVTKTKFFSCKRTSSMDEVNLPEGVQYTKSGVLCAAGSEVGEFKLGSTICLIFEAPYGQTFRMNPGDKVTMGEILNDMVIRR